MVAFKACLPCCPNVPNPIKPAAAKVIQNMSMDKVFKNLNYCIPEFGLLLIDENFSYHCYKIDILCYIIDRPARLFTRSYAISIK